MTSAVLGDLYPTALDLGRVDGTLYGLAYTLDVEQIAYRPVILNGTGFGFVANHSLVMASFISRANAAVIDLRNLLSNG